MAIAQQEQERRATRHTKEEADALLKRQGLPAGLGSSDVANLDDLLDFADHLTEEDMFQLTHQPRKRRLLEQAEFVAASADENGATSPPAPLSP